MKNLSILKSALTVIASGVCVIVSAQQLQLPELRVYTINNQVPISYNDPGCRSGGWGGAGTSINKSNYVGIDSIRLTGPNNNSNVPYAFHKVKPNVGQTDSIRLRGNSTMTVPKSPFRIKFDKKTSFFGKEPARSWILLANFYDKTMLLNAIAFELGKRLELQYTPTTEFVDVYLNGVYRGIYHLTEQKQVNPGRVDIDKDFGWLVEFDYHDPASDDCLSYFTTPQNRYNLTTFIKSPEDLPDSTGYRFVKRDIFRLVDSMASSRFPENGYRAMLNLESWAKYVLIQQLMDNFDFNSKTQPGGLPGSNYAYKDMNSTIFAGPLWDFDLAAGVAAPSMWDFGNFPTHYTVINEPIRPKHAFYQRLWEDPVFLAKFKIAWDKHQNDFNAIPAFIDSIANVLASRTPANFSAYSGGEMGGDVKPTNEQEYRGEITKLKNWWTARMQNFTQQINAMNIDISKDIPDVVTSVTSQTRTKFTNGSSVAAARNGINLSVIDKATVKVFRLDGREVRTVRLTGGNHSLRFADLPKGMYMVRVSVDGEKRALRTLVK
jgi:hypothetical protein